MKLAYQRLLVRGERVYKAPPRVRIAAGWVGEEAEGFLLAVVFVEQEWGVVLFDGADDPETFKMAGLEFV